MLKYAFYFETRQGSGFTNQPANGFDMVVHESRKYGLSRALKMQVAKSKGCAFKDVWMHVNDVAGFIGPECLEPLSSL
jgi:ethanolamine ammonia-lyase large subunit